MSHSGHNGNARRTRNGVLNKILGALPAADFERLSASLTKIPLSFKQMLHEQDRPITQIYFVETGMVSLTTNLEEGTIETGTVGREGVVGLPALLGMKTSAGQAFCQIPGSAFRMSVKTLETEREDHSVLMMLMFRYAGAFLALLAQSAACNRAHTVEQRLARWLLMSSDRVESDEFLLTQEFLAQMLGVRRPSVNVAGLALQRAGLIQYRRGKITILERKKLEAVSCECYAHIKKQFANTLRA